jgi:hypothetical protein
MPAIFIYIIIKNIKLNILDYFIKWIKYQQKIIFNQINNVSEN